MTPEDDFFPRLVCNLHQSAKLLHQLIGSIVETMRFLGPKSVPFQLLMAVRTMVL
jgi:hypothetical protein